MKIFNWVHRRFYHQEGFGTVDVKKPEFITSDTDGKALLENAVLADVFDGWRGGILAIGTFGLDPLKQVSREGKEYSYSITYKEVEEQCDNQMEEYSRGEDECDEVTRLEDEDELNPLVYEACQHGFEKDNDREYDDGDGIPQSSSCEFGSNSNSKVIEECGEKGKKKERITLADLFSAESDMMIPTQTKLQQDSYGSKLVQLQPVIQFSKKTAAGKNGLSFAKKFIPRVGEDARARPIQKLHRLVTKMLKRKIHPDFEGKIPKKDCHTKSTEVFPDEFGANESISLLPNQDANV